MAKLSERVMYSDNVIGTYKGKKVYQRFDQSGTKFFQLEGDLSNFKITGKLVDDTEDNIKLTNEENTMTNTLRELTVTLIDNNPHLEDDQRIIFQKKGISTTASYDDVKLDLIATGEVMPALKKHNEGVRSKAVREDILENTGREVYLKAIKKLSDPQLEWRFVATA